MGGNGHWSCLPGPSWCLLPLLACCAGSSRCSKCAAAMYLDSIVSNRIFPMHFDPQGRRPAVPTASSPNGVRQRRRRSLIVLAKTCTSGHDLDGFRSASSAAQARLHRASHLARRRGIFITAAIGARNSGPSPAQHLEEARCHVGRRWLVDAVAIARRMAILAGRDRAGEARQPWAMGCRARMDERSHRSA